MANADCRLPSNIEIALNDYEDNTIKLLEAVLNNIRQTYEDLEKAVAHRELNELLEGKINDVNFVNELIYKAKASGACTPEIELFHPDWITYRFFQIHHLHAIDTRCRYENFDVIQNSEKVKMNIVHDIHDMDYLMLALLEGNFATKEKKLEEWWRAITNGDSL